MHECMRVYVHRFTAIFVCCTCTALRTLHLLLLITHFTTPHRTTLYTTNYTTLHNTIQHCTTLHYTTLHYTTLHNATPHNTIHHYTSQHPALHHFLRRDRWVGTRALQQTRPDPQQHRVHAPRTHGWTGRAWAGVKCV
jgi:hypothetical protein